MIPDINLDVIYFHRRNELLHFCQVLLFHSYLQPNVHFTKSADCKSQFWQGSRRGGFLQVYLSNFKVLICKDLQPVGWDVLIIRVRPFSQKLPYNSYWNYCCKRWYIAELLAYSKMSIATCTILQSKTCDDLGIYCVFFFFANNDNLRIVVKLDDMLFTMRWGTLKFFCSTFLSLFTDLLFTH